MTLPEIRKRLRFWEKELNLQDWSIKLRVPKAGECLDAHAEIQPVKEHGKAELVIHEGVYAEFWLCHELGHVVLVGLNTEENSKAADLLEERAINRYTAALCRAYRIPCPPMAAIMPCEQAAA